MRHSQYKNYIAGGVTAFCVIAASLLLFFLLFHAEAVCAIFRTISIALRPVFIGMIIAFLLLPVHRGIFKFLQAITENEKLKNPKNVSFLNTAAIILSLLVAFFGLYLLLAMVMPQVYLSLVGLVQAFPGYINSVQRWLQAFLEDNPDIQAAVMPIYDSAALSLEQFLYSNILPNLESVPSTIQWLQDSVLPNLTGVVSNVSAMVMAFFLLMKDLLIALIVSFYLLAHKDIFAAQSKKLVYSVFPTKWADFLVEEVRSAYRIMSGFINGKLVDSLIIGVITLVCCNLFHFPYPALVATVVGVTNIIPFFGPYIGAVPCALLILLVSPLQCVYFIIFIFILQQFDGNILGPKILGESTGLSAFWVLFSILLFGGLFGFAGMILGVPVFAMLYSIVRRLVNRGLKRHNLPIETEHYLGRTGPMA
jgi:predicted PurR-regulated permease PerM